LLKSRLTRIAVRARIWARWARYNRADRRNPPARLLCRICEFEGPTSAFRELRARDMFHGGTLIRHECPSCDVIFGTQRMLRLAPEELAREYRDVYSIFDEGSTTKDEVSAFQYLYPERGCSYLNYGAGKWSKAIEALRAHGFDIVGFDRYEGAREHVISDEAALRRMRFDGIMSHNLLEHLVDPVAEMRFMRSLLRDEHSRIVHATSCFRYEVECSRFHLFFFPGRSPEVLAQKAGMRVEHTANPDVKVFAPLSA
jgi:hypothetical protein